MRSLIQTEVPCTSIGRAGRHGTTGWVSAWSGCSASECHLGILGEGDAHSCRPTMKLVLCLLLSSASATARLDRQPLPAVPSSPRWLSLRGGDATAPRDEAGLRSPAEAVAAAVEALDPAKHKTEPLRSEEWPVAQAASLSRKAATSLSGGAGEALAGNSAESPAKVRSACPNNRNKSPPPPLFAAVRRGRRSPLPPFASVRRRCLQHTGRPTHIPYSPGPLLLRAVVRAQRGVQHQEQARAQRGDEQTAVFTRILWLLDARHLPGTLKPRLPLKHLPMMLRPSPRAHPRPNHLSKL